MKEKPKGRRREAKSGNWKGSVEEKGQDYVMQFKRQSGEVVEVLVPAELKKLSDADLKSVIEKWVRFLSEKGKGE